MPRCEEERTAADTVGRSADNENLAFLVARDRSASYRLLVPPYRTTPATLPLTLLDSVTIERVITAKP
jgi:hypothetical protein